MAAAHGPCHPAGDVADAGGLQLHVLAQRVAVYFPNNITRLVDMSGKKHLHQGVVRLPIVVPQRLAHVIQEALRQGAELRPEERVSRRHPGAQPGVQPGAGQGTGRLRPGRGQERATLGRAVGTV